MYTFDKAAQKFGLLLLFKKLPKVNNCPLGELGEILPNLATLFVHAASLISREQLNCTSLAWIRIQKPLVTYSVVSY
jgi:hypothetical protein